MAAGRGERYTLMVVASVLSALPVLVQGAPPYATRHPRREPPCNHDAHPTLCWAVQLKQPLHFKLPPVKHSSHDTLVSFKQSVIKEPDLPLAESTGDSSVQSATKVSNLTLLTNMNSTVGNLVTNLSQPVSSVDSEQSRLKQSLLSEQGSVSFNQSSSQSPLLFSSYDDPGYFGKENKSLLNALSRAKLVSPDKDVAQTAGEKANLLSDQSDITDFSHREDTDSSGDSSRQQKIYVYHQMALLLAAEVELSLLGKVGELYDHFVLCHETDSDEQRSQGWSHASSKAFQHYHKAHTELKNTDETAFERIKERVETSLHGHHDVAWFTMEAVHHRQKRFLTFNDPALIKQWHLVNRVEKDMDINVTGVWHKGFTGTGVTAAVVDDGLEWKNPDIHDNYNVLGSWDLNDNDPDPSPHSDKASNHHGTRCGGEIAAVANTVCGVGVAYGAKLAGIRLLDGPMTDSLEAQAFNMKFDINAIYSCSWGPDDNGRVVDGPHILSAKAMKFGVEFGRKGYGSIFVVASGNGGNHYDNCNYDGYANSIYTVTIGAVDEAGTMPYYAEECASMLGVTFSSGTASQRNIVTTDWLESGGDCCTDQHTGTSAAAPLAAGMIALMLQAQPCLTWRDVQYLLIITSVKVDVDPGHWHTNGAGLEHSHKHGFGLLKGWRLVNAARVWKSVPYMSSYFSEDSTGWDIPHGSDTPLTIVHTVTARDISGYSLYMLEYVQVTVTLTHPVRGKLGIYMICPSGTMSVIGAPRPNDNSTHGFTDWTFTTVRCWGEGPTGEWKLVINDTLPSNSTYRTGRLIHWRLTLFGTPMSTDEFQKRRQEVEAAMGGQYLMRNVTPHCDPPPVTSAPYTPLSMKTLKILFMSSMFCVIFAFYETMEYMMCHNEEKRQQAADARRAAALNRSHTIPAQSSEETAHLLQADSEQDSEFLRNTQSAFNDENDEDMFFLDAGLQQPRPKGRGRVTKLGERIHMSTFRTTLGNSDVHGVEDDNSSWMETPPSRSAAKTSVTSQPTCSSMTSPSVPNHQGASRWSKAHQGEGQTETLLEQNGRDRGPAKSSILPALWKALVSDEKSDEESDSDSDSQEEEEEVFTRGKDGSSVSLLGNTVGRSHR